MTQSPPILRRTALTKRFSALMAVDSLELQVAPGTIFGLLGPNGAACLLCCY